MKILVGVKGFEISLIHSTKYFEKNDEIPHGHTYFVETYVEGEVNERGFIIDLRRLEKIVREVLDKYDRKIFVPEDFDEKTVPEMMRGSLVKISGNATIENIAYIIAREIYEKIREEIKILRLKIIEGSRYIVEIELP